MMTLLARACFILTILALLLLGAAPGRAALTPVQQQYLIEKAKLENLKRVAYEADPNLKRAETQLLLAQARMKKKQDATREAIDRYLAEHKLTREDLARFRLEEITAVLMRINPAITVSDPALKELALGAVRRANPLNPAAFQKKYPGKKAAELSAQELLAWHQAQLKAEADKARAELDPLVKLTGAPAFMVAAMDEITKLKCQGLLCRSYLDACTPAELKAQQVLVARMERAAAGK